MQDESLVEKALISPNAAMKKKKSRGKKRLRTNSASEVLDAGQKEPFLGTPALDLTVATPLITPNASSAQSVPAETITESAGSSRDFKALKLKPEAMRHCRRAEDKIVSPVVPQPGARKRPGFFPRIISKELPVKNQRHFPRGPTPSGSQNPNKVAHTNQPQTKDCKKFQFGNYDRYVVRVVKCAALSFLNLLANVLF